MAYSLDLPQNEQTKIKYRKRNMRLVDAELVTVHYDYRWLGYIIRLVIADRTGNCSFNREEHVWSDNHHPECYSDGIFATEGVSHLPRPETCANVHRKGTDVQRVNQRKSNKL